jgi:hypothetical protein
MNTELQKSEFSDFQEKIQSGQLVIGLSSAIPGFIKKDPNQTTFFFAPFYARERWVNLPIGIVQEQPEHLPLSFSLKPGGRKEKVLEQLIDALAQTAPTQVKGNGADKANGSSAKLTAECGTCARCPLGDGFCVDCYL